MNIEAWEGEGENVKWNQSKHFYHFFTLKHLLIAHYFNTFCKTHAKIRRSNPLKFISLLHVSILKDHHQGVNVPIYEVIEYFLFLLMLLVWWRHACGCVGYVMFGWSDRCLSCAVITAHQ